tara:strand:+ start:2982 stop:5309 length:2328 start_codon:yes stop_codon:yes gene_type:complete
MPEGAGPLGESSDEVQKEFATIKARFKTDIASLSKLTREFGGLKNSLRDINTELTKMIALGAQTTTTLQGIAQASGGVGGGGSVPPPATGTGGRTPAGSTGGVHVASSSGMWAKFSNNLRNANTEINKATTPAGMAINLGLQGLEQGMGWTQTRIKAHAPYALSSDRMGMLLRQMEGGRMTQLQYQANFREPLTNYLIGNEGITPLLGLQATTGLNATQMAKGVEGIRVASGFGYSTQDATRMIRALAQPGSSNMMTMMLGMGLYGPGGSARDPMDVIRNTVQRMGLDNPAMLEGALQPGSMTRANLARTGLPMDMQDLVIQYAQENVSFQELGGKGMYDPSNKAHRRRMGVEEGYATEFERTRMAEADREENFYRRQIDNYAQLEKNTQRLIEVFGALEDTLSPLIGAQVSLTNKWWRGALPLAMGAVGAAIGTPFGMPFLGGAGGYAAGHAISKALGDPEPISATDFSQFGLKANLVGSGAPGTTGIQSLANLAALPPSDGGISTKLTLTSGTRTKAEQWALFADKKSGGGSDGRHTVVGEGHLSQDAPQQGDRIYEGKYYRLNDNGRKRGYAAPPGKSRHQTGAAADLGPNSAHAWIAQNVSQFGMRTATNEDWHVTLSSDSTPPATDTVTVPKGVQGTVSVSSAAQRVYAPTTGTRATSGRAVRVTQSNVQRLDLKSLQRRHAKYSPVDYSAINQPMGSDGPGLLGDPIPSSISQWGPGSTSGGGGGPVITISPTLNLSGSGNSAADAQRLADQVIRLIETSRVVQTLRRS